jgi:hypothetical protein
MRKLREQKKILFTGGLLFVFGIIVLLTTNVAVTQTENMPVPENTNIPTPPLITSILNNTSGTSNASTQNATTATAPPTVKCELCHTNPQDLSPHVNGGKLCINCHGSQVHNIHVGEGTANLDCKTCHGFPPTIPTVQKGTGPGSYSVCEQCHAPPPDSLKPSNGSLIVIHLSRGIYCTNCHGTDIGAIHAAAINATTGNITTNISSAQINATSNTTVQTNAT